MLWSRRTLYLSLILLFTISLAGCQLQEVIEEGVLTKWFWSRLGWAALISAILGAVTAKLLCRLPIRAPLLDCISKARSQFAWCISVLVLVLTPALLWVDAIVSQPFGEGNELGALRVLYLVVLELRMLGIMFMVGLVFYLAVGIFSRFFFGRTCNCKYAFIPKVGR